MIWSMKMVGIWKKHRYLKRPHIESTIWGLNIIKFQKYYFIRNSLICSAESRPDLIA
jgi:hypothetical protein